MCVGRYHFISIEQSQSLTNYVLDQFFKEKKKKKKKEQL